MPMSAPFANAHISELQAQAEKLEEMIGTLRHLVRSCRGENRAECPIMADLSSGPKVPTRKRNKRTAPRDRCAR